MMGYGRQRATAPSSWNSIGALALGLCLTLPLPGKVLAQNSTDSEAIATAEAAPEGSYPAAPTAAAISEWLRNNTNISPAAAIAVGSDMVVSIARFGTADPASGTVKGVTLRGEAISPKFAELIRGRSTMVAMDVDCDKSMILIYQTDVYPQSNLIGTARVLPGSKQWIKPVGTAYLADTIVAVCKARGPATVRTAQAANAPSPAPAVVSNAAATGAEVQVVAASSPDAANAALDVVRSAFPNQTGSHSSRIQAVQVGQRTFYRALLTGFSSRASALDLCNTLKAGGHDCLVR